MVSTIIIIVQLENIFQYFTSHFWEMPQQHYPYSDLELRPKKHDLNYNVIQDGPYVLSTVLSSM